MVFISSKYKMGSLPECANERKRKFYRRFDKNALYIWSSQGMRNLVYFECKFDVLRLLKIQPFIWL